MADHRGLSGTCSFLSVHVSWVLPYPLEKSVRIPSSGLTSLSCPSLNAQLKPVHFQDSSVSCCSAEPTQFLPSPSSWGPPTHSPDKAPNAVTIATCSSTHQRGSQRLRARTKCSAPANGCFVATARRTAGQGVAPSKRGGDLSFIVAKILSTFKVTRPGATSPHRAIEWNGNLLFHPKALQLS